MPGSGPVRFAPDRGSLTAPDQVLRALISGDPRQRRLLVKAGAVDARGRHHEALRPMLEALRRPVDGVFQLSYRGRALEGWRGLGTTAVLTPPGLDGSRTLASVPRHALLATIVRAAGLGRRPRPPAVVRLADDVIRETEVVRWWRLVHRLADAGIGGLLEVLDTTAGLYLIVERDQAVPTDAEAVAHLVQWLLDGNDVLPPLNKLPPDVELPRPAPA